MSSSLYRLLLCKKGGHLERVLESVLYYCSAFKDNAAVQFLQSIQRTCQFTKALADMLITPIKQFASETLASKVEIQVLKIMF